VHAESLGAEIPLNVTGDLDAFCALGAQLCTMYCAKLSDDPLVLHNIPLIEIVFEWAILMWSTRCFPSNVPCTIFTDTISNRLPGTPKACRTAVLALQLQAFWSTLAHKVSRNSQNS
jgi:hypothetical protein